MKSREGVNGEMASLLMWESYESDRMSSGVLGDDELLLEPTKGCDRTWLAAEKLIGRAYGIGREGLDEAPSSFSRETLRPVASRACMVRELSDQASSCQRGVGRRESAPSSSSIWRSGQDKGETKAEKLLRLSMLWSNDVVEWRW